MFVQLFYCFNFIHCVNDWANKHFSRNPRFDLLQVLCMFIRHGGILTGIIFDLYFGTYCDFKRFSSKFLSNDILYVVSFVLCCEDFSSTILFLLQSVCKSGLKMFFYVPVTIITYFFFSCSCFQNSNPPY